jgi:hypothetical protein
MKQTLTWKNFSSTHLILDAKLMKIEMINAKGKGKQVQSEENW